MSKKSLIILITFLLILFGGVLAYLFLSIKPSSIVDTGNIDETTGNPFPFGTGTSGGKGNGTTTPGTSTGNRPGSSRQVRPALHHLSLVPVAGAGIYQNASSTQVRYIERGTGYIYQSNVEETEPVKLSNTPIIKIYEALWSDKSTALIIQKLKDDGQTIDSFLLTMSNASFLQASSTSLAGSLASKITPDFLGSNMQSIALSPKRDRVVSLVPNTDGGVVGIISKTDGSKKVQIFDSPLKSWLLSWPNENTLTFTTKALSTSPGLLYFASSLSGKTDKILGGINGLTTLTSSDANTVLFSKSIDGGLASFAYDIKNGNRLAEIGLTTLPEKCVWSKKEKTALYCGVPTAIPTDKYPEAWYQGKVSFSDEIWKIDTLTGILENIADLKNLSGQDIDVTHLTLSEREDLLVFINKADLTLWSFDLR